MVVFVDFIVNIYLDDCLYRCVNGVPITACMQLFPEKSPLPIVPNAEIDFNSETYRLFARCRDSWRVNDQYENPGPLQFNGPTANSLTPTLYLESFTYLLEMKGLYDALQAVVESCRPGCSSTVLNVATKSITTLHDIISMMNANKY